MMKRITLLLLFFSLQVYSLVFKSYNTSISSPDIKDYKDLNKGPRFNLIRRQDDDDEQGGDLIRKKCSPPKCGQINDNFKRNNGCRRYKRTTCRNAQHLWRRMRLPNRKDFDDFMVEETDSPELNSLACPRPGEDIAHNTAIFREFGDEEFSIGMARLVGCTSLIVVSRTGVYVTHYYEDISFAPDDRNWEIYNIDETADDRHELLFERTVTNGLTHGVVDDGGHIEQTELAGDNAALLQQNLGAECPNDVRAYLIRAKSSHNGKQKEHQRWFDLIRDTVQQIVPLITNSQNWWKEIKYVPVPDEEQDLLETTGRGRVLFKYDPRHVPNSNEPEQTVRKATLWSGRYYTPFHNDEWNCN